MNNRYSRAIERVEVTAEMRGRIMKNIGEAVSNRQSKPAPGAYRKYIPIAACFLLLLIGAFVTFSILSNANNPPPIATGSGISECGSLGELSETVGFNVREVTAFPFSVRQTAYTSYFGELAQITYTGENNELTFRMSAGSEENSGDYGEYSDIKSVSAGSLAVTLKGNGEVYNLAVWQDGGYSYSIRILNGVSAEEILNAALSLK